jgi:predicted AAA+ superfamily ATPase
MKPRILEHAIRRAMQTFPAVIITGPRQSGKTTLLTERFSKTHRFVSILNSRSKDTICSIFSGQLDFTRQLSGD